MQGMLRDLFRGNNAGRQHQLIQRQVQAGTSLRLWHLERAVTAVQRAAAAPLLHETTLHCRSSLSSWVAGSLAELALCHVTAISPAGHAVDPCHSIRAATWHAAIRWHGADHTGSGIKHLSSCCSCALHLALQQPVDTVLGAAVLCEMLPCYVRCC